MPKERAPVREEGRPNVSSMLVWSAELINPTTIPGPFYSQSIGLTPQLTPSRVPTTQPKLERKHNPA
jgi:hypothetical protein